MSRWDDEKLLRENPEILVAVEALTDEQEQPEEAPPPPDPAEVGAKILEDLAAFISRFVYLTVNQAIVLGLWVLHTHALAAAMHNPIMHIFSPEKESGKTRPTGSCRTSHPQKLAGRSRQCSSIDSEDRQRCTGTAPRRNGRGMGRR